MEIQEQEQSNNGVADNLRRQLALAIKSIDWCYAIFWSISSRQPGVLEWGEGYYNGDIKTRKTVQVGELSGDHLGLQRTEQLRELYESLSAAESNPAQPKRPSAALSPEDLTDTEWYFLVCMSFIFNIGQGLPGRSLAKNQTLWLCNAHQADNKAFTRSLLAKSAAIQTVICFPYLGGVVELGVTEPVSEDRNLIQHIKRNFLDNTNPIISIPKYVPRNDRDFIYANLDENAIETDFNHLIECHDVQISTPNSSTNGSEFNEEREESHMVEAFHGEASQVQSWQFMEDELSNYVHNSSDCVSQTPVNPRKTILPYKEKLINGSAQDFQDCNRQNVDNFDPQADDEHYQTILSTLLKSSHQLILGPYFRKNNRESSFVNWKKERSQVFHKPRAGTLTPQRVLKKALFEVVRMHGDWVAESRRENGEREKNIWRPEADEIDKNHVMAERKRREKLNERFTALGSLVPSTGKVDKISILDDTIEYLKDLERRIEELKGGRGEAAAARRKPQESAERISVNNYGTNRISNGSRKSSPFNKRKASYLDENMEHETEYCRMGESSSEDVTVSIIDKNVSIEINCPWRESLLLEIMDAVSDLNLESQAVQSSNTDGIFSLTIKSKFKGSKVSSASMIRQALQRVIRKS